MMNQDQYHASLLNKGQPIGLGWDGITKSTKPKLFPQDPPNMTDVEATAKQVKQDDPKLIDLNWNNIKVKLKTFYSYGILLNNCFFFFRIFLMKGLTRSSIRWRATPT